MGTNLLASLHCLHSVTYVYAEIDISKVPKSVMYFWNYSDHMQLPTGFKYSLHAPPHITKMELRNRVVRRRSRRINLYFLSKWDVYSSLAYREVHRNEPNVYFHYFYDNKGWIFATVELCDGGIRDQQTRIRHLAMLDSKGEVLPEEHRKFNACCLVSRWKSYQCPK